MSAPSLAAVLFTDLVDSTAQHTELGDEAADLLRRTHDRLLTDAIEAHGGRVVKSTGDGIMATFPGAAEATAGAIAVQQAIDRHNRRTDALAPLSVRTGLSAGDVTWEDDDAFGTPSIEAARICDQADGGQILASDVVRLLAGTRTGDVFVTVGDVDLKGLPGPTAVCEIHWEPATEPAIPVPGGLRPVGGFSFVGRETELELLTNAWDAVVAGERRAVFLAGEPGIGKTRLVSQFAHHAADHGSVVLYGRAEQELGIPYKPIVEALTTYTRTCPDRELANQMGSLSGEITRLVPQLVDRVPDLAPPLKAEPETQRYRLFEAVTELLATASQTWPLVLVLDDLQWAAKPTIALLSHLLHTDLPSRLLLIGAYRDTEVGTDHPLTSLLADTHRIPAVVNCTLGGLAEPDVSAMTIEATGEERLGEELTVDVFEATDGNAFFVSEILRAVATIDTDQAEIDLAALGVPDGAVALVSDRVARLDPLHRPVLDTAAVVGQRFDLPLLCAVIGEDDLVLRALAEAETTGLIGTETLFGGQQFAHALIRDALYTALPPTERVRQHSHIATALERLPDCDARLGELAYHYRHAIPLLGIDPAVTSAGRAGDQARAKLAFEEAATHYRTALDALAQAPVITVEPICDLQIALAEALYRAGDYPAGKEHMLEAADTARRLDDPTRFARAALTGEAGGLEASLRAASDPVTDVAEEALERLDGGDSIVHARLLSYVAARISHLFNERSQLLANQAIAMARRLDDGPTLLRVLQDTYTPLQTPDNLRERIEVWGDELMAAGYGEGDLEAANRGLVYRASCYMEACELDLAETDFDEAQRHLDVLRQPAFAYYVTLGRASLNLIKGRLDEAEALIDELLRNSIGIPENSQTAAGVALTVLLWQRGQLTALRDATATLAEEQPDFVPFRVILALILAETGSDDDARRLLEEIAADEFVDIPRDALWLTLMTTLAYVAIGTNHERTAAALEAALRPYAERIATQGHFPVGPVATALGSLAAVQGNYDLAEGHYRSAVDLCERWDLRSWLAVTRLHWARMLSHRNRPGDETRAGELAHQSLTTAEDLGMRRVADQARDLLGSD